MKYIKQFEELSSSKFFRAARKLKKMGHLKRSASLSDWGKKRESEESIEKWEKNVENYSIDGDYLVEVTSEEAIVKSEFYILLSLLDDPTIEEWISSDNNQTLLSFTIGLIPKNRKCLDEIFEAFPEINFDNGFFWTKILTFNLKLENNSIIVEPPYIDIYESEDMTFCDRKSAVKFKKLIIDVLTKNVSYPSGFTDITDMYKKLEDMLYRECSMNKYDFKISDIAEAMKLYPINNLWKS